MMDSDLDNLYIYGVQTLFPVLNFIGNVVIFTNFVNKT